MIGRAGGRAAGQMHVCQGVQLHSRRMDQPLNPAQADAALRILRAGDTATAAARYAKIKPAAVYAEARRNPDFLLALAGHDPYGVSAARYIQQADYIRHLALGLTHTEAVRILFKGDGGRVAKWRQTQPEFAIAADAARRLNPPAVRRRREHRFTPHRVRLFLDALRNGTPTTLAAEDAGVTPAVIYQRRRRDAGFRVLMDAARTEGGYQGRQPPTYATQDQWDRFAKELTKGKTLRRAALDAGIEPTTVYKRRSRDEEFRRATARFHRYNRTR